MVSGGRLEGGDYYLFMPGWFCHTTQENLCVGESACVCMCVTQTMKEYRKIQSRTTQNDVCVREELGEKGEKQINDEAGNWNALHVTISSMILITVEAFPFSKVSGQHNTTVLKAIRTTWNQKTPAAIHVFLCSCGVHDETVSHQWIPRSRKLLLNRSLWAKTFKHVSTQA